MKRVWETCRCGRALRVPVRQSVRCTCGAIVTPCSACRSSDCDNCPYVPKNLTAVAGTAQECAEQRC